MAALTTHFVRSAAIVGCGGFLGSIFRYLLSSFLLHRFPQAAFPWGTFAVNLSGSLLVGFLAGAAEYGALFSQSTRIFIFAGILGGFTTFSAFSLETLTLLRKGDLAPAVLYCGGTVVAGLILAAAGFGIAAAIWKGI